MGAKISRKGLNAWQIKLFMAFLMVLNHLEYGYGFVPENFHSIFNLISRCVAPMFAYLAIEGIIHTRNLKKYCLRLCIWTAIVFSGNILLEYLLRSLAQGISPANQMYLTIRTNICITLAAGLLCIAFIIWSKEKKGILRWLFWGLSIACFIIGFFVEWGVILLPFMLVTYFLREKKGERYLGYVLIEGIALLFRSEIYYFTAFPFIALYNGKRGPNNKFNKYFFYIFYPLHLWIIAIINYTILLKT